MNQQSSITLENAVAAFQPFDEIRGTFSWNLESPPKSLELRLFWFTSGRGTSEASVVEIKSLTPGTQGQDVFSFTLPGSPYSVSGSLVTIQWALELVAVPIGQLALQEITVSPTRKILELPRIDQARKSWWQALQRKP